MTSAVEIRRNPDGSIDEIVGSVLTPLKSLSLGQPAPGSGTLRDAGRGRWSQRSC
jgi:hypothetical protein